MESDTRSVNAAAEDEIVQVIDLSNKEEDELLISEDSKMSTNSEENIEVKIGKIIWPSKFDPDANGKPTNSTQSGTVMETDQSKSAEGAAKSAQGAQKEDGSRRRNRCGAEKRRRRKAREALAKSDSTPAKDTKSEIMKNKRPRSPAAGPKVTPPPKRTLNTTPPNDKATGSYSDVVQNSLVHVVIGDGITLTSEQVERVMSSIIRELEKFIGTGVKAPSFGGRKIGESEIELRCADDRTVKWLKDTVPTMRPWKNATLKVVTMDEWETMNRPKRMLRMCVTVPWRTTGNYFMDVLRSNNPELRTRYWEIKNVQDRGNSTRLYLKVDDVSAELLESWGFKAYWLLDSIEFKYDRGNKAPRVKTARQGTEANTKLASEVETASGSGDGGASYGKQTKAGTPITSATADDPTTDGVEPGEASQNDPMIVTGISNSTSKCSEISKPANSSVGPKETGTIPKTSTWGSSLEFTGKIQPSATGDRKRGASRKTGTSKSNTSNGKVREPAENAILQGNTAQTPL